MVAKSSITVRIASTILQKQKTIPKPLKRGYPTNPQTIGEQIRKKRMDLGLHQTDIGRIFKVSKDCVTNWEKGRNEPHQVLSRIIAFLGYNPILIDESTVAGKVFAYRCAKGLNRKRLAKMLKVDENTVKAWENGKRLPNDEVLLKMYSL